MQITTRFNDVQFEKDMKNIISYAIGFLDGAQKGKPQMLRQLGNDIIQAFKEFVDSNARVDPKKYHHIYEWYQTGSPNARLFDIKYVQSANGLSFKSSFSQSKSIQNGSTVPFYNKTTIMEKGMPVKIIPINSQVLVFEENGQKVFTKSPVTVDNPGGDLVVGAYENIFKEFFNNYFAQSFLYASGIKDHLSNPIEFKTYFYTAKRGGKSAGMTAGLKWITNVGVLV